jgi:hypothetical protein
MIEIKKANNQTDFKIIEELAYEIMHEVYDPIIPAEHTDYFLTEFQSETVIENQITDKNLTYYWIFPMLAVETSEVFMLNSS